MRVIYLLLLTGIWSVMANAQNNTAYSAASAKTTKEFTSSAPVAFSPSINFQSFTQDQYNSINTEVAGNRTVQKENEDMTVIEPVTGSGDMADRNTGGFIVCPAITTFPFTETFEDASTTRTCWINEFVNGTLNWTYGAGAGLGGTTTTAHGGALNALFTEGVAYNNENVTKLVSPPLNLSSLSGTGAQIRFWAVNEYWEPDQDLLRVYYKTSAAGSWVLLSPDITDVSNWTEYTFTLPSISSDYYIAFESTERFGRGVAIDDVTIEAIPSCSPPSGLTIIATGQSTARLNWAAPAIPPASGYEWKIVLAGLGSGAAAQASGTTGAGVLTATATGLNPGTSYDLYVRSHCGGANYSSWTGPKNYKLYDDAPGALTLTVGAGCTGADFTNAGATKSNSEVYPSCSGAGNAPVWFRFTAPTSGAVRITTDTLIGSFTDSKLGLFSIPTPADVTDYSKFTIISCDEDGGSTVTIGSSFGFMAVLYATGLTPGTTYYIAVDKFNTSTLSGTFCIAVDEFNASMIAPANTCADLYQQPVGSNTYSGWVPLMNVDSKLVAMVQNPAGGEVDEYTVSQNINNAAVRQDAVSKEYYLDRNFHISNSGPAANVNVQFFFLNRELTDLHNVDAAAALSSLRITRQTGSACQANFTAANGTNYDLAQTGNGTANGVSWIKTTTPGFSNFYIHSAKSPLIVKTFLQGAYSSALGRHKDVTTTWRNILNANALSQPYNTTAFGNYNGGETVPAGFFTSDAANARDILDWVLLEVKDGANALVARRAALLREDGKIVDVTGDTLVTFNGLGSGNYYLTIRHRNHLGISVESLLPVTAKSLGVAPPTSTYNFDFTTATDAAIFGTSVAYKIIGSVNVMVGGNANSNGNVRFQNVSNDPSSILLYLNNVTSGSVSNVYNSNDVNMDGIVRFQNVSNDPAWLLNNALNNITSGNIIEQKR